MGFGGELRRRRETDDVPSARERFSDESDGDLRRAQNELGIQPEDAIPEPREFAVARGIRGGAGAMASTVDLDGQSSGRHQEVDDRIPEHHLPTHFDPEPPRAQRFPQRGLRPGGLLAHLRGALGEEFLTTELSALTSEHGHLRRPGVVGGPRDPGRTICDAPLASASGRACAFTRDLASQLATRRGAERAPTSGARPPRRAEASCLRSSRPSTTVRFRKHARLPHSGKARIWGRPTPRSGGELGQQRTRLTCSGD